VLYNGFIQTIMIRYNKQANRVTKKCIITIKRPWDLFILYERVDALEFKFKLTRL
jgi:hypothetical protein